MPGLRAWADLIPNLASPSPAPDIFADTGLGATRPQTFDFNEKSWQCCELRAQGCRPQVGTAKYRLPTDWSTDGAMDTETEKQKDKS